MSIPDIDAALVVELDKRWEQARVTYGDVYSALCRPGSWEFQLDTARTLRELLRQNGYEPTTDPDANWRLIWKRMHGESDGHGARRS